MIGKIFNYFDDKDSKSKIKKNKIKILHIYNYFEPNKGYIENYLPREEAKKGHKVIVLAPQNFNNYFSFKNIPDLINDKFDGKPLYFRLSIDFKFKSMNFYNINNFLYLLIKFHPDIVFIPYLNLSLALMILFKYVFKYKLIASAGMPMIGYGPKFNIMKEISINILKYLSHGVDLFVECTPENVCRTNGIFGVSKKKILFFPLGADITLFNVNPSYREEIRKRYHIDPRDVVYIYAGKILPEKNIDIFIKSFAVLRTKYSFVKLMILGTGTRDNLKKINSLIADLNLGSYIVFLDMAPHQDLVQFYNAADVGVWPGSPSITIQEAMASGLPVILEESNQTSHLIKYDNGCIFKNSTELAECMERLIDPQLRTMMGKSSRKFAEDYLDWARIAEIATKSYIDLFR